MTQSDSLYLGVDLGSVSLKAVLIDEKGEIVFGRWVRVAGEPLAALKTILGEISSLHPNANISGACATGSGRELIAESLGTCAVNEISAHARASRLLNPLVRSIIEIGGQDSKLIILNNANDSLGVHDFKMNELCAAGTGAFLDQQATRLGISIEEFSALALGAKNPVAIAGRCAVFAKTDMTHHQQEGAALSDIVAGLNEALVLSYMANLVRGKTLPRPIAFQGGVASNAGLVKALRHNLNLADDELVIPKHHRIMGAIGCALSAMENPSHRNASLVARDSWLGNPSRHTSHESRVTSDGFSRLFPPSHPPVSPNFSSISIDGAYLGIDVGSVSVKLAAINDKGVVYEDYRFSNARPLESLRAMLKDIPDYRIFKGVGVTGSGRQFIGRLIRADVIQNEITAQARAATFLLPDADTIIEIGGQDSKFMRLAGERAVHFAMNRVCAAGTGAFLEEQAKKLGIAIEDEFANEAFASESPAKLGARCTVFMESDLVSHQQLGFSRRDLLAGLARSVVANYCEKVVSGRPLGEKILFLGGVSRNLAVHAALEEEFKKSVATSTLGGVSGAIGAAFAAFDARAAKRYAQTSFNPSYAWQDYERFVCKDCSNRCTITKQSLVARDSSLENQKNQTITPPARTFGGRCGKWDENQSLVARVSLIKKSTRLRFATETRVTSHGSRSHKIGIPRALLAFDRMPAWRAFFESINCEIIVSPKTDDGLLSEGIKHLAVETCLPVKAFCAHIHWFDKNSKADYIFVMSPVIMGQDLHGRETVHCPYIQGLAQLAAPMTKLAILNPVINWRIHPRSEEIEMKKIARRLGASEEETKRAWQSFCDADRRFRKGILDIGTDVLKKLENGELKRAFVLLGKDYNLCDSKLNSNASKVLESFGETVISQDMIASDKGNYSAAYRTMYWTHGKEILAAAEIAKNTPGLFPVMITSFGCGPDSFTIPFLRDILGDKPWLLLEVDEHSSSVGMETRIEAFLDSLPKVKPHSLVKSRPAFVPKSGMRRVYLPNFSDHSVAFGAAVRVLGFEPVLTSLPDDESARLGGMYATNGECHPFVLMLGDYIKAARECPDPEHSCYLMPESGACRVGQFGTQMRLIAEELRLKLPVFTRIGELTPSIQTNLRRAPLKAVMTYWEMMRGCDFLMQKYYDTRAYELKKGGADRAHEEGLALFWKRMMDGHSHEGFKLALNKLRSVAVDKKQKRLRIGITGDYYTRIAQYANGEIFREIERLGGVVMLPPTMTEFIKYDAYQKPLAMLRHRKPMELVHSLVLRAMVGRLEKRVRALFDGDLTYDIPLDYVRAKKLIRPYMNHKLPAGLTGSVAAIMEQIGAGADGILNLITFHCNYGLVLGSVLASIDKDFPRIPKLTLIFEGLKPTHNRTRLEAFMERVREGARRC